MPSLDEVLSTFPDHRFLINVKSGDPHEGDLLAERLMQLPPEQRALIMAYGGDALMERLRQRVPGIRTTSRKHLVACGTRYLAIGWTGYVPDECRSTLMLIPENMGWVVWGWPNRFFERMHGAGTEVFVIGPYASGDPGTVGVDTRENVEDLPENFSGGVWTNRIDRIAPLLGRKTEATSP